MKSKNVAFGLSFLIAGAGLAYLGLWKQGAINLALALGIGVLAAFLLPEGLFDTIDQYLAIGIGSGSGAVAMLRAEEMNAEAETTPTLEELSDEARLS